MSFKVSTTAEFESDAKILQKRHRSFKNDLKDLIISLEENPFQGVELSPGIRKIRMAIASKGRGKSGGARVITYTVIAAEMEGKVYLMSVYDKADFSAGEGLPTLPFLSSDRFLTFHRNRVDHSRIVSRLRAAFGPCASPVRGGLHFRKPNPYASIDQRCQWNL